MGCCAPLPTKHTWKYRGCEARHIFGSNDGGCASPQYTVEGSVRKKESRREKHDIFAAHDGACSQSIKTVVSLAFFFTDGVLRLCVPRHAPSVLLHFRSAFCF